MASLNPLDNLTFGEMYAAAECCAEACAATVDPTRRYHLRNVVAKLLSAALQVEPTQADFDRCAAIMRRANGG